MVNTCVENTLVKRDKRLYNRMVKAMQDTQPGDFKEFQTSLAQAFGCVANNIRYLITHIPSNEIQIERQSLLQVFNKRQRDWVFTPIFQKVGFNIGKTYDVQVFGCRMGKGCKEIEVTCDITFTYPMNCRICLVDNPTYLNDDPVINPNITMEWNLQWGNGSYRCLSLEYDDPCYTSQYIHKFSAAIRLLNALAVAKDKAGSITEEEFIELARLADSF